MAKTIAKVPGEVDYRTCCHQCLHWRAEVSKTRAFCQRNRLCDSCCFLPQHLRIFKTEALTRYSLRLEDFRAANVEFVDGVIPFTEVRRAALVKYESTPSSAVVLKHDRLHKLDSVRHMCDVFVHQATFSRKHMVEYERDQVLRKQERRKEVHRGQIFRGRVRTLLRGMFPGSTNEMRLEMMQFIWREVDDAIVRRRTPESVLSTRTHTSRSTRKLLRRLFGVQLRGPAYSDIQSMPLIPFKVVASARRQYVNSGPTNIDFANELKAMMNRNDELVAFLGSDRRRALPENAHKLLNQPYTARLMDFIRTGQPTLQEIDESFAEETDQMQL